MFFSEPLENNLHTSCAFYPLIFQGSSPKSKIFCYITTVTVNKYRNFNIDTIELIFQFHHLLQCLYLEFNTDPCIEFTWHVSLVSFKSESFLSLSLNFMALIFFSLQVSSILSILHVNEVRCRILKL